METGVVLVACSVGVVGRGANLRLLGGEKDISRRPTLRSSQSFEVFTVKTAPKHG